MSSTLLQRNADTLVIFDFETTGMSPDLGDRAIEIGAVLMESGVITARFQQLMNPGIQVPVFIENFTGISNKMVKDAKSNGEVMAEFYDFIADHNIVAHNASFDERFLRAELQRINKTFSGNIGCSLLSSRRVFQQAPNHQLATLVAYKNLPSEGLFHRALADAEATGHLWLSMLEEIRHTAALRHIPFSLMIQLSKTPKHRLQKFLQTWQARADAVY